MGFVTKAQALPIFTCSTAISIALRIVLLFASFGFPAITSAGHLISKIDNVFCSKSWSGCHIRIFKSKPNSAESFSMCFGSATATKSCWELSAAFNVISGPIPHGSPDVTITGFFDVFWALITF